MQSLPSLLRCATAVQLLAHTYLWPRPNWTPIVCYRSTHLCKVPSWRTNLRWIVMRRRMYCIPHQTHHHHSPPWNMLPGVTTLVHRPRLPNKYQPGAIQIRIHRRCYPKHIPYRYLLYPACNHHAENSLPPYIHGIPSAINTLYCDRWWFPYNLPGNIFRTGSKISTTVSPHD